MVLEKVKAILSNQFDVEEDSITPETNIADDLGADSLDVVDMLMSLEDDLTWKSPMRRSNTSARWAKSWPISRSICKRRRPHKLPAGGSGLPEGRCGPPAEERKRGRGLCRVPFFRSESVVVRPAGKHHLNNSGRIIQCGKLRGNCEQPFLKGNQRQSGPADRKIRHRMICAEPAGEEDEERDRKSSLKSGY